MSCSPIVFKYLLTYFTITPKIKSALKSKISNWIAPYNGNKEVFSSDENVIFCRVCEKSMSTDKKCLLDHNSKTSKFSILPSYCNVTYLPHIN